MIPSEAKMLGLVGHRFPGGAVTIQHYEDFLMRHAALAPAAPGGAAHGVFGQIAAMAGAGVTWGEIFALCRASAADGPMLGEIDLAFDEPLRTGTPYLAEGGITAFARKQGKRSGILDLVTCELELRREGRRAASAVQVLIFPRRA